MRRFSKLAMLIAIVALGLYLPIIKAAITQIPTGIWAPAGNGSSAMSSARSSAATAQLQDGRLLVTGGSNGNGAVSTADFFSMAGNFAPAPAMNFARTQHTATVLQDGTVLVTGGADATGASLNSAEIFDPSSGAWIQSGSMLQARSGHTATLLSDGTVLIAGGVNGATALNSLEIYNPTTGTFTFAAGVMSSAREAHAAALLEDGRVLITGGWDGTFAPPQPPATTGTPNVLTTTDIYDPTTGLVTAGPALNVGRTNHTATTQLDGKVFVVGGNNGTLDLASAEVFDPSVTPQATSFTLAGVSLTTARSNHSAFLLPHNGGTLIVGGTTNGVAIASAELYMPVYLSATQTATLNPTPNPMSSPRVHFTGSPLSNGNVNSINDGLLLVAGGTDASGNTLSSSELYGFAWVKTDALEYAPGSPVTITGGGFQPGETVTLHFQETPYFDTHPDLTVVVQADGTFSNSQFAPDIHDLDIGFYLTATGSASGFQAQTVFADASPTLKVTGLGTGGGSVTSSDGNINCTITAGVTSGACSHSYSANFSGIILTAHSAAGSTFIDWSGGCSGTGTCSASATGSNTFTAAATFDLNQAPAIISANSTTFVAGSVGSFTVTDTGTPTPALSESGTLPTGVTFNASTGVLSGTATTAGTYPITVTAGNGVLPNATQNFTLTVAPGAVNAGKSIVSANPTSVTADGTTTSTITVTLEDAINNPVSGKSVTLSQGTGHSTISAASGASNASGVVTFTVKGTKAEAVTYTATDTTDSVSISQTATVTFTAGAVIATASTVSASPASVVADGTTTSTITVTLLDANSNPVSGKTVTLAQGTGHSTISPGSATTNASGIATFAAKDTKAEAVTYTATDTTDSVTISQTATVTFTAGAASATMSTVAASPTSVTADGSTTSTITVTLLDANSNPASGRTVTLVQGTGHSTISSASGASNSSGVVTFTVKDTKAEVVTYTATDTTDSVTVSQTATVTFTVGPVSATVSTVVANPTSVVADGSTTSTITVTLLDANSNPVSGKAVSLTAGSGSSTINTVSGTTNASGQATFTVKDTAVESVTYTAKDTTDVITIAPTATVNFTVGAVSGSASTVVASPTSVLADGTTTSTITVTLFDSFNHPVSGRTVTLAQGAGNSTITPASGTTNASGLAAFTVKDTKAETLTYTAKDTTDSVTIAQTAQVTFNPGTPAAANSAVTANPTSVTADGTTISTITVTLEDAHNNPVSGKTVTLAQGGGSSMISPLSATTNASGVATFTVKDTKAEVVTYTATDTSDSVVLTQTAQVTFNPGALAKFVFSPISSPQTAGTAFNVTITAEDVLGNTVTSFNAGGNTVTISSTGTLSGGSFTSPAFTNGVLVQSITITNTGNFTLTATGNAGHGGGTGTSNSFTVNPGVATHFTVNAPATATAGTPINFTVTALDAFNNTAMGYLGTVRFAGTDSQAVLPANYTFAAGDSGVHTFSITLKTAGNSTITASDSTNGSITGTSGNIAVAAGASASITASAGTPQSATINTAFAANLGATVKDAYGNPVSGASVTFAAPGSGASGAFAGGLNAATTNSSGAATAAVFTANGTAGSYNVTASVAGVSTSASFSLTNNNPTPTLVSIAPTSGILTQTLNVVLTGTNFLSGVTTVSFGADLTVNSVLVNSGAQITVSVTIPSTATLGAHSVSVTNPGPGGGTATLAGAFTVIGTPPQITSAAGATFTAGTFGTWTITTSGTPTPTLAAIGSLPSGVTFKDNGNGTAALAGTTTAAGSFPLTITAQNGVSPNATQNFTLTVNPAPLTSIVLSPGSQTITAGSSAAFTATGYDQYGNRIGDVTSATTFTVANGACAGNLCSSTAAGMQAVSGNDSGIIGTATLNVLPGLITHLALMPASTSISAGGSQSYTATGLDAYNNLAGDVTGSTAFAISPDGSCTGANCTTNLADINGSSHTVTGTYSLTGAQGTANLTVTAGSAAQLQLLMPGETAAPGTTTGKTGTPNTQYVNGQFPVTVNAVDQYWNVVSSVNDVVQITSTDANAILPSNAALASGTGTFNVSLETVSYNPAKTTLTASDLTNASITAYTSPAITVIVVYTASISPTDWATGQIATYTLTINNAPSPNANNLASIEVAVPQSDQGTINIVNFSATNPGNLPLNWSYDTTRLPGTLCFFEVTPSDAVTPGGAITITFTATSNAVVNLSPVAEVWDTTAFSDAASKSPLPLAPPEPTVNIGAAPQITSAGSTSTFIYGTAGTIFTVTTTGVPTAGITESGSFPAWATFTDNHDGTATISGTPTAAGVSTFTITAHNGYGNDATQNFTLNVNQATATINVMPYSVTYDGTAHTATATATGVGGVNLIADLTLSGTTHTNAGTYGTDAWSFHDPSGNYADASGTVSDLIKQANAAITVTPYNVTFDANPHTASGTAIGVSGENLIAGLTLSGTTHTNAGTYATDAWSFHDSNGNYADAGGTVSDLIKQAIAMIVVMPYNVTYDANPHSATATALGVGGVNLIADLVLNTTHTSAGTYATDSWTFHDSGGNYADAGATITDVISPATLTITPNGGQTKTYGTVFSAFTGTTVGLVGGNSITVTYTSAGVAASAPVGGYDITVATVTFVTGSASNYSLVLNTASGGLTVTAAAPILPPTQTGNSTYGTSVTLTVTISAPGSGEVPTGKVQFQFVDPANSATYNICPDGSLQAQTPPPATPCTVPLDGTGTATVTTTHLPAGMTADAITATYIPGDGNYLGGNTSINYAVSQASTQATLNILPAATPTYGDTVTLSSTVSDSTTGSTGTATGTVQFEYSTDGGTTWINIGAAAALTPNPDLTATATTTTTTLPAGTPSIKAVYSGDSNFIATNSGTTAYAINPKNLTVSGITASDKPYDGSPAATLNTTSEALVGVIVPDVVSLTGTATGAFTDPNAGSGKTVNITGLSLTGAQSSNYTLTEPTATASINKVQLTVTAPSPTVTYGDPVPTLTPTITGFVNGEGTGALSAQPICSTTYTESSNAGSAQTTSCSGAAASNYSFAYVNGTVTVNKANVTLTVTPYNVTYDANPHTAIGTVTGVGNVPMSGLSLTGTNHTNAGDYPSDPWTFTDTTGNYNNANGSVHDIINKANATIVVTPYNVTYDANPHSATGTVMGVGNVPLSGLSLTSTTHTNAGNYPSDAWTFTDATGNYNNASGTVNDVINRANATISVTPYNVTYDSNPHSAAATATGVGGVNLIADVTLNTTHTNAGNYSSDSWSFTDPTGNYNNVATTTFTDVIKQATVTLNVTPYSVTYDGTAHTATATATGVGGVNLIADLSLGGTTHTGASTYATDAWTFHDPNGNYADAGAVITDVISPATLMIMAGSTTVNYGMTVPPITPSFSGFVPGESAASLTTAPICTTTAHGPPSGSPAGNYSTSCSGAVDNNYTISYKQGAVIIQAVPLTITASSGSMIYGGPVFPVTPIYTGFANGDAAASLTAQPGCSTLATSSTPVGAYPSSCAGAADSNYTITYVPGSVSVVQATTTTAVVSSVNPATYMQMVTFTATVTPQYSGTTPTGTVTFYNQGSPIGTGTLSVASCNPAPCQDQATFSTTSLPDSGPDSITAVYGGDTNFIGSPSPATTQTVNPAPNVNLNPLSVSFGNQNVNTTSSPTAVILANVGDAPLTISSNGISITPNTDFSETNNCGSSLAAGKSCSITITFTPVDTGIRTASLQITDNDDDATNAQQTVALTGSGLSTITGSSLYTDAIFATANGCGSIVASGGGTVDSFNSALGFSASHELGGGNVGTNGNVSLNGSKSTIYGSAAVDSTTTGNCSKTAMTGLTSSGGGQVTGGLIALNGPITYPSPPAPAPAPPTTTQNISGSCGSITGCTNNGSKSVSLAPGQYGNLTISGGTTAHFSKGAYNINSLTLSGQSIFYVDAGPVVVNLAGASLSGSNPALDASGGSIQNPSGIPANLQITYAGSRGVNLTGGSGSYATLYAPGALVNMSGGSDFFGSIIASTVTNSGGTAVHYDANLPSIQAGNYIWFSAVVNDLQGLPQGSNPAQVKLYLTDSTITFTANGTPYSVPVPNAVVTLNSTAVSSPKTSYDLANSRWSTSIPASKLTGNTFVTGIAIPVPAGGFPSGIQNVSWSAAFSTDTPGVTLQWQWGAAVYSSSFNPTYATSSNSNVLGVNVEDGSADTNGTDPAGTPETYKTSVVFGATGGGLTNYTGFLSSGAGVVPTTAPMSVSPSSLAFSQQSQGTTSVALTAVLTNNDSISHAIYSITTTGTNASDFAATNTCPASLAAGTGCTITVTFTPSDVGTRTAKVVISDDAKNSPLTVYLSGTGQ